MVDIWWIIGALAVGIAIGALVVWSMDRKAAGPGQSVKALREESEKFRDEVNDHFVETAELINQLTDSYKKVFDHLSDGAERLVDDKVIRERMPEVSDQEIRLGRIGQTTNRASKTAAAGDAKPVPEAESGAKAETAAGLASKADSKADSKTDSKVGSNANAKPEKEPKSEAASEKKPDGDKDVPSAKKQEALGDSPGKAPRKA